MAFHQMKMEILIYTELLKTLTGDSLSLENASLILSALEVYALQCYNVTATHKYNVTQLDNIDDVYNYQYTTGYPEKLHF